MYLGITTAQKGLFRALPGKKSKRQKEILNRIREIDERPLILDEWTSTWLADVTATPLSAQIP